MALLTAARGKRHVSPDTVGYGRFAGCSSSLAAGVLMWESYVDVVFFIFIFTTDTITWKKATQRSQVFIPNTFETLCVECVLSGVEAIGVVLSSFGPI